VLLPACAATAAPEPLPAELLSTEATEDDFPTLGVSATGELWTAWVAFDDTADRILLRRQTASGWSKPEAVSPAAGDFHTPGVVADGDGRTWVVWAANESDNWDLVARYFADGKWSRLLKLTDNPLNDFNQKLARSPDGTVWVAWQAVDKDNYEVLLAKLTPAGLSDQQNVSQHSAGDWEPAVCNAPNGTLYVAWDTYRNGSYDVYLRELAGGKLSPAVPLAATAKYEAHASVACDPEGRCWIAWDEANPNWGRSSRPVVKLHQQRNLNLAVYAGGRLMACPDIMGQLPPDLRPFCELPEIAFDGKGNVWLFLRHLTDVNKAQRDAARAAGKGPVQTRGIWNVYASRWDGKAWAEPALLADSNGRNDQRASVARDGQGGLWIAFADDGRRPNRAEEWINHNVHVAQLPVVESTGLPPRTDAVRPRTDAVRPLTQVEALKPFTREPEPRHNRQVTVGGTTCELVFGDTHRHTDLSRCGMNYDGSLIDTYRYAIDCAQLDFLAISDHDQDIQRHRYDKEPRKLKNYGWWRSQKYADLFTIGTRFLGMYGYEHGGSYQARGGHKNIVYTKRGMPCFEEDAPEDLFKVLKGKDAIAIPHQLADGGSRCDWDKWNPTFERVAEIFQARGSYEYQGTPRIANVQTAGFFLWDAYAKDVRVGIIASSDHGLTHGAYAGAYVKERSREAVLEALRARRTYGATETIEIDLRSGNHWMGEELPSGEPARLQVTVRGVKPLREVAVVKNGNFVFHKEPNSTDFTFEFADPEPAAGPAYYYVRARQVDDEIAWSSPVWVGGR
jgi:hypothetical protein